MWFKIFLCILNNIDLGIDFNGILSTINFTYRRSQNLNSFRSTLVYNYLYVGSTLK